LVVNKNRWLVSLLAWKVGIAPGTISCSLLYLAPSLMIPTEVPSEWTLWKCSFPTSLLCKPNWHCNINVWLMCILIRKIGYLVNPLAMQELSPSLI